ncbi:uncharacterized protein F5891DRAFT_1188950 [Suillus fuscotomentosus]|uniref:Uncharacterized protein n=1 Tax=Suillus fuscotomentosus TaxID=1912939 RepID=A0AAD4E5W4_9AGAM|nr:uncharacterized protein F5891DRAFT_1188950 [Suillus fuscotomentosus]KAG1900246.1 hypothetical protein F5891DRAFT_1188950 [Suillus fuscotomentosus]
MLHANMCACSHALRAPALSRSNALVVSNTVRSLVCASLYCCFYIAKEAAPVKSSLPARLPPVVKGSRQCCKSAASQLEGTLDEKMNEMNVGPAPKMGIPYVVIPPAPKIIKAVPKNAGTATSSSPNVLEEDDHTNLRSLVWDPGCSSCVQRQLVCRQGFNTTSGKLAVCVCYHRLKHHCGGKGSAPLQRGKKSTATVAHCTRLKSCQRPLLVHVAEVTNELPHMDPVATITQGPAAGDQAHTNVTMNTADAIPATSSDSTIALLAAATNVTVTSSPAADMDATTTATPATKASTSVLSLTDEVAALKAIVSSLQEKQEATYTLLAKQMAELQQELLLTSSVCLPVIIGKHCASLVPISNSGIDAEDAPAESASIASTTHE